MIFCIYSFGVSYFRNYKTITKCFLHYCSTCSDTIITIIIFCYPAEMVGMQFSDSVNDVISVIGILQRFFRIFTWLNLHVSPVVGSFTPNYGCFPSWCGFVKVKGIILLIVMSKRIPVVTKIVKTIFYYSVHGNQLS